MSELDLPEEVEHRVTHHYPKKRLVLEVAHNAISLDAPDNRQTKQYALRSKNRKPIEGKRLWGF